jgi:hypothetical protein
MKRLFLALAALSLLATAIPAKAGNCQTTCTPWVGGGSNCFTHCY